ncbi:hypothetical protein OUZ56_025155 [Daphnia magna]|uniref:Uncharacterized protein n=1 Tax=Daphnia magna TaxID=35525 RepID=A0ABQ9ZJ01_9CRUS|nr:hypothetical protein OUZ56_025155 [Daphnia magna]
MPADKYKIYYFCIPSCNSITHCEDAERAESLQMTQKSYGLEYHHLILLLFIGSSYLVSAVLTSATYVVLPTGWIGIPHVIHILFACSSHSYHYYFASRHMSLPRPSPLSRIVRQHMSSPCPSLPRPSPRLRLALGILAIPSSLRTSLRHRLLVAPSSSLSSSSSLWYRCIL